MTKRASTDRLTIRAAVLRQPGRPMAIESLTLEAPGADEVLVRLAACGVCHTDIDFWESGAEGPVVLGHEGAGVVEAVGARVRGVAPGDHVILSYQSCGACPRCLEGRPADCERFWEANFGFARLDGSNALAASGVRGHFFGQSSFATHALATERNLVRVDRELPLPLLAPLGCGFQTGAGTVMNSLAVRPGRSLLVLGAGSVGLAAVMAARIVGAEPIIVVDRVPARLRLAEELGADHTLLNAGRDLAREIAAVTGGGVDHILESTGHPDLYRLVLDILAPGGSAALLAGMAGSGELPEGRSVRGVIQGDAVPQRFIPELIGHHLAGRFPIERLVTYYPFAEINTAMADSRSGLVVKPVLRMDGWLD